MTQFLATTFLGLHTDQWWIILIGVLACSSAGLIGSFLILRKLALMGDAISHSVLPGIAVASIWTGSVASFPVLIGASVVGVLTPMLVDALKKTGRIYEDASIGVVFTVLFSIGVIMVSRAGNVDLDIDCVLYGEIAMAPFDVVTLGKNFVLGPRAFLILAFVFVLNVLFVTFFYKELKVSSFDPALAESMGLRPRLMHYLLLGFVALTTIAAFESVGAIIVVAMLIAPGATAYLLTDRLGVLLFFSALFGALAAFLGYMMALGLGGKVSIAGCIAVMAGALFEIVFFFSPSYGMVPKAWRRLLLARRLAREHILGALYRLQEDGPDWIDEQDVFDKHPESRPYIKKAARQLMANGMLLWEGSRMRLTNAGFEKAITHVRAHRLWESFLEQHLNLPPDHVHRSADDMEHFLGPDILDNIVSSLENPEEDPHGQPIPKQTSKRSSK